MVQGRFGGEDWKVRFSNNLWSDVVKRKYINIFFIHQWLRDSPYVPTNVSIIWKGLFKSLQIIRGRLSWIIGRGVHVYIRIDSVVGLKYQYKIFGSLISSLHSLNL